MAENDLRARYAELPTAIRERIEQAISDAQVALKLRIGKALADKSEVAAHEVTQADGGPSGQGRLLHYPWQPAPPRPRY